MRKTFTAGLCLATAVLLIGACSPAPDSAGRDRALATIGEYRLSLADFETELAAELELDRDYKLTRNAKREFLDTLIGKELLIQEAVRLKLDRQDTFQKSIEKYWESTLIRDLIALKSREIDETIVIAEEEITERYGTLLQASPEIGPLTDELQAQLRRELKASKKSKRLSQWIDQLKNQTTIEIDEALLAGD